ncbi:uncharacterized protein Eint_111970 [Encephalitozoon intestinalis ATCC 50506]|uniref:Uncharacterized protein n=1 Tax=Encephalitozoon intestinalis (strain ATCC 50506) TaxID=876142 RepID=E0SA74_ENCIT|nr:uncharacterized protein Eint_111970 [Encephalitozoon intestinalis ATCC 50506]ADM12696.1 hypothetical protein Eint_111970 [Encephalitozoon intestinalis ATCC 50506]UTX45699.1 hypothetical protein GPK93_07g12680 [Encephalitozoon intestinalis]UTX45919.1 no match found [Encephalitozoon intestinalis]
MGHLWKTALDWAGVLGQNLRKEFDGNARLKDACSRIAREWSEWREGVEKTGVFWLGQRAGEISGRVMRLSDASMGLALEAAGIGRVWRGQREFQKRLNRMFRIPQYYGGIRKSEGESGRDRRAGGLVQFRPSLMGMGWRVYSWIRRGFGVGWNDLDIEEIENEQLSRIFEGMEGQGESGPWTEEGAADIHSLWKEIGGSGMSVVDIRNVSTVGSIGRRRLESGFEVEIAGQKGGKWTRHVFVMQAVFERGADGRWSLGRLRWTRVG